MWLGEGVRVMVRVGVGVLVRVGVPVGPGVGERLGVGVRLIVGDKVRLGAAVGASPWMVKRPETSQFIPTKICTSYSPGSHKEGSGFQSV